MSQNRIPWWLWIVWGLSLSLTAAVAFNVSPWLFGDADWRWRYLPVIVPGRIVLVVALLALYVGAATWLWAWAQRGGGGRRGWWVATLAVGAALAVQIVAQTVFVRDPFSHLMQRTTSPYLGGYHDVALSVDDAAEFLHRFPSLAPDYLPHAQRHPPGLILYFVGLERLFERLPALASHVAGALHSYRCEYWPLLYRSDAEFASALGGLLALVLNAVAILPLFAVGRALLGERVALAAVLISPLVPGYAYWAGIWDQGFVLVTALLLWFLHLALAERRAWAWWAAGGLLSFGSFVTFGILPLLGLATAFVLLCVSRERAYWWTQRVRLAFNGLGFLLGLGSVWLIYWLAFGVSVLDVYRANTAAHFAMPTRYVSRLFYNPYDFTLFLGFGPGLMAMVGVWQTVRARLRRQPFTPAHCLIVASALTIGVLTVSGLSRAEVGRVWLFLAPLAVLTACAVEGGPAHSVARWVPTAALLAGQLVVLHVVLYQTEPGNLHTYAMPPWAVPVGTRVGEAIELQGYELWATESKPGDTVHLTLHWNARQTPAGAYVSFVHLYDPVLGLAAQHDGPPRNNQYPTTCWRPGEVVSDNIDLAIDPNARPGVYPVIVGFYDPATPNHQRLPTEGPGARDLAIVVTEVRVNPELP